MNNKMTKRIAIVLSAALVLGCVGTGAALAVNGDKEDKTPASQPTTLNEVLETAQADKDETVYVLANADGTVQKIIVSDWIKNTAGSATLTDQSQLTNVENVKGDETYTMNGEDVRVWDAQGGDIFYQGNLEKELPVDLTVSYQLDGVPIAPSDLAGKSGHLTIRFDYTNKQYTTVKIDGKDEKMYVPFVMLTGMILDNDVFSNIEVSNGRLLNDGNHTVVAGLAFPGLQENLNVKPDKLEIPNYVEITADVQNFEMGNTVTIAMNDVFSGLDTGKLDKMNGLNDSLDELTDAMGQLLDGSSALYDGLNTLLEKSGTLTKGIDQLASGGKSLKDGAGELYNGAAALQTGAAQLSSGLQTLDSNTASLNSGAKQVFQSLLSMANSQLKEAGLDVPTLTISNYADVLNNVIASLDSTAVYNQALAQVTAAVEAQRDYIHQQVTAAIQAEVTAQVTAAVEAQVKPQVVAAVRANVEAQVIQAATGLTKEQYDAAVAAGLIEPEVQAAITAQIDAQMASEQVLALIEANTAAQMGTEQVQATISAYVQEKMASADIQALIAQNTQLQVEKAIAENMASPEVQAKLAAASEGAKAVINLKASLDGYNSFYIGLRSYTAGVSQAAAGAGDLKSGADSLKNGAGKLYNGASDLYNGILTLKNGTPALVDGITQLRDGALKLSDGMKEFNEKGIEKLVDAVDGDLNGLLTRLKATVDVSKEYTSFSGISQEMDGQVKFIYRTDSIDAE